MNKPSIIEHWRVQQFVQEKNLKDPQKIAGEFSGLQNAFRYRTDHNEYYDIGCNLNGFLGYKKLKKVYNNKKKNEWEEFVFLLDENKLEIRC